eukprot:gnl/MRDRNA2_/MRDRNA2_67482_c0_seq1.p1 gnl/MRDRNA2_/MRDRNA2_67482_c0~~gnl/MRDRNA2_/MRDRNA2_67482_c0_seq1.p1  ORF type:complete len:104 (+),score=6.12 gnl/MRDRNA2_/MRDRNA2_67482_c0_seq1:184-495(+)
MDVIFARNLFFSLRTSVYPLLLHIPLFSESTLPCECAWFFVLSFFGSTWLRRLLPEKNQIHNDQGNQVDASHVYVTDHGNFLSGICQYAGRLVFRIGACFCST